jgi:hypothetical protein
MTKMASARSLSFSINTSDFRLSLRSRITIYRCFIRPILEYGLQIYSSKDQKLLKKIDQFQFDTLSRLCGIKNRSVNRKRFLTLVDIDSIFVRIEYFKYLYYHSILRKPDSSVIKILFLNDNRIETIANLYKLSECYETLLNKKKEPIVGHKRLKYIRIFRFNQTCQSDKVLCIFDTVTEIPKLDFIFELNN